MPVLNVTRLKHIKNSPFTEKSQKSQQSGVEGHQEDGDDQSEEFKGQTRVESNEQIVEILELPGERKICKPYAAIDKCRKPETGIKQVVTEIAKLIDQFFDVQVMI